MHPAPPTDPPAALREARDAYHRQAWVDAHARLSAADRESPLPPDDLERLAVAAYLLGRDAESTEVWARAHHEFAAAGSAERAVRCAFWLAIGLLEKGALAQGSGWLARAHRLLDAAGRDCVERGYLLLPEALRAIDAGDAEGGSLTFARAAGWGERFGDRDLMALARHGQGRALIRLGRTTDGVRLLDEAMVAVTTGEVSPIVAGDVYCSVISGCQEIFDWRRAAEWTAALARWCAAQPGLVTYRGQCLLRRSEVLQLRGEWSAALGEARRACERLADPPGLAGLAAAWYQLGELHRLRGETAEAEAAFRQAVLLGRRPQPGLALLHLARGETAAALTAITVAVEESPAPRTRARLLPAYVEIALAAGDVSAARPATAELAAIAAGLDAPYLRAVAGHARGALLLAEGDPRAALAALREAESIWRETDAPHEEARTRALLASACRALGDLGGSELEREAARAGFERLGAAPELARLERVAHPPASEPPPGLTARELEVLRLVAAGRTNRAIGAQLRISEKTVARHLSNIFVKLGLSSRAAATAWAYEHALVPAADPRRLRTPPA
ncbi:MAG TPA: LuxR C-terminal-related transcriptional regulator [Gemmatimonadales bacterium]|nr:LuxR C-terminal-related transcriptional regulator [Gemmatimonadales bacterium]